MRFAEKPYPPNLPLGTSINPPAAWETNQMAVHRVDLFFADSEPPRQWIIDQIPAEHVVRTWDFTNAFGSYFVAVFNLQEHADAFRQAWSTKSADDWSALVARTYSATE